MDGRHQRARTSNDDAESEPTSPQRSFAVARWSGVATSLTGTLVAILTFPTVLLKIVGAVVCLTIGATTLAATRDRNRRTPGTLAWLLGAGAATLALVIVQGLHSTPAPAASAPAQAGPAATTTGTVGTALSAASAPSNAISLADLTPIKNGLAQNLWTTDPVRLNGIPHDRAVAATGAWCGSTQIEYALDGKFTRFTATVGIADQSAETKPLDFYVLTDGIPAAELRAVGGKSPKPVDVPVTGAARLVIGVKPPAGDPSTCPGPERVGAWAGPLLTPAT